MHDWSAGLLAAVIIVLVAVAAVRFSDDPAAVALGFVGLIAFATVYRELRQ